MPNYVTGLGAQFVFYTGLVSQADTKLLQVNPTIAAGDFKISIDGGAFANLTNLPAVTPAGGRMVKIILSAAEVSGTNLIVQCVDAAGTEWCDTFFNIQTTPTPADLRQIDATALVSATFNLKQLNIVNSSGHAIIATGGSNGSGISAAGNGTASGISVTGGATGNGILATGGSSSGSGVYCTGNGNGPGITAVATSNNSAIVGFGSGSGHGLQGTGGTTGSGIVGVGGVTSGSGIVAAATTNGAGIIATGVGSGNSGLIASASLNGPGISSIGNGTGQGFIAIGGSTGNGINGVGGTIAGAGAYFDAVGGGAGITAIGVGAASLLATQGISGPLDASVYTSIADAILKRDMSSVTGEASRSLLNCLRFLRNKWSSSGSTMTITKEDDSTSAWTATVTTDALALPVIQFVGN